MRESAITKLLALLDEQQDTIDKIRETLIEADQRNADIARQDAEDKARRVN